MYQWQCIIDNNQQCILNEAARVDNLIQDEYNIASSTTKVTVSYDIANVVGVYLRADSTGTNYATNNNFIGRTITLNTALPYTLGVFVTYRRYSITNYLQLLSSNFGVSVLDDTRFTIQIFIDEQFVKYGTFKYSEGIYGNLINTLALLTATIVDNAKAAGITAYVTFKRVGAIYNQTLYNEAYYGFTIN